MSPIGLTESKMTPREFFDACYNVLVQECGASENDREAFLVNVATFDRPCREWRFIGSLGFDGKFYVDSCHREDETAVRLATISRANGSLRLLSREPNALALLKKMR